MILMSSSIENVVYIQGKPWNNWLYPYLSVPSVLLQIDTIPFSIFYKFTS